MRERGSLLAVRHGRGVFAEAPEWRQYECGCHGVVSVINEARLVPFVW
jgi:hypothetical protein